MVGGPDQSQGQDPEYILAETGRELERLHKQHAWLMVCTKGKMIWAPIDLKKEGLKVLDVGCADGTVIRALKPQLAPSAELVGVDVMPSFLSKNDPQNNIRYTTGDINDPFDSSLQNTFDLAHIRFVLAASGRAGLKGALQNVVDTLKPGGWLQVFELDMAVDNPGYTPAVKDLLSIIRALIAQLNVPQDYGPLLVPTLQEIGLTNVRCEVVALPAGKKLDNEADARNSVEPFYITIPSVIGGVKQLGGTIPEGVEKDLPQRFEREMMEEGAVMRGFVVTGQKPT